MNLSDLAAKIQALYGYTPTSNQLLNNPDLINIAIDAIKANAMNLSQIAAGLNTLFGSSYTTADLIQRPDLVRLGLNTLSAESGGGSSDPSQITSDTLPTTRADGSALQTGDRWYKPVGDIPNSRGIYIREGLLWVTAQKIFMNGGYGAPVNPSTANANLVNDGLFMGYNEVSTLVDRTINFSPFTNMFISGFAIRFYSSVVGTNFDANNRFDLRANILNSSASTGDLITTVNSGAVLAQNGVINFFPMSSVVNISANAQAVSATVRVKNVVGTPAFTTGTLRPYWSYILQGVHP